MAYHHNSLAEGQILALLHRPAQQPGFLFLLMSSARSTVMKRSSIGRQITGKTGDINVRSWHEETLTLALSWSAFDEKRTFESRRISPTSREHDVLGNRFPISQHRTPQLVLVRPTHNPAP